MSALSEVAPDLVVAHRIAIVITTSSGLLTCSAATPDGDDRCEVSCLRRSMAAIAEV